MNKFGVGDKIRCIKYAGRDYPKIGEEYIITCVAYDCIGFVSEYPIATNVMYHEEMRRGTEAWWQCNWFELVQTAEEIASDKDFNSRMKEINESV